MKKFFLLIALFILIVSASYFIPVTQSNDVVIKTNFDNVLSSLKIPGNWEKWNFFIKKILAGDRSKSQVLLDTSLRRYKFFSNTDSLIVEVENPLLFDVQEYQKDKFSSY